MRFITLALLLCVSTSVLADSLKSEEETKVFSDKILQLFTEEKFEEGLNNAKTFWPLPDVEIDGLANQINLQWSVVRQRFGASVGMEHVETKRIGKSFLRHIYLHKFANHAIYWQIDYYKPNDVWLINSLVFLDQLDNLYQ